MMISQAARRNLEAHIAGERAGDIDAALAPLSDDCSYVIPGYVLHGKGAVRAMYELALPHLPAANFDEYLRALDDPAVARWGEDHCVLEYTDDYPHHRNMVVVIHFEGDRVRSENTYYRTLEQPSRAGEALAGVPGVMAVTARDDLGADAEVGR